MTEKELVEKLAQAEQDLKAAQRALTTAKKRWTEAETLLIGIKLERDRISDALREHRATVPSLQPEITLREQEIEDFRKSHPEECALALERDLNK